MSQSQKVGENSIAVQSEGDTVFNQGITPSQMSEIMDAISKQISSFSLVASQIAETRLTSFKEDVLNRFTTDKTARTEAFKDPDFQYLLGRAQHTFARSGDEDVGAILTDLIAERSKETSRTRMALTLNSAVEKAAVLTKEEFSILSLCFVIKRTRHQGIISRAHFISFFNEFILPFLDDIKVGNSSILYLQSEGCCYIQITTVDAYVALKENYAGIFLKGMDKDSFVAVLPENKKNIFDTNSNLLIPCLNNPEKVQLSSIGFDVFANMVKGLDLDENVVKNLWNINISSHFSKDEIIEAYKDLLPQLKSFFEKWEESGISKLELTTTGIAIAHSNLQRICNINAPLDIWIK